MRVLVVDDSESDRELARDKLRGHDVAAVGTVADALALIDAERFDVVMLDLHMPENSSLFAGIQAIRKVYVDGEILMFTGVESDGVGLECIGFGASDLLDKDTDADGLNAAVLKSARRHRARTSTSSTDRRLTTLTSAVLALTTVVEEGFVAVLAAIAALAVTTTRRGTEVIAERWGVRVTYPLLLIAVLALGLLGSLGYDPMLELFGWGDPTLCAETP